jgi:hypothetical protein
MDLAEINRYLYASVAHSITVDVIELDEAPGTLRTITIRRDNSVTIEFPPATEYATSDFEGGGLKYRATYDAMEDAVSDLESFLGKPLEKWRNFTEHPYEPRVLQAPDPKGNIAFFENLVRTDSVPLPTGAQYRLTGIHWRHVKRYGMYRPDKLDEEQDLHLAEIYGESEDDSDD